MAFDLDLLEGLLHEDEGTSLDFKRAQYPFENANAEQKAELLKDILAFANSWRRTSAYILIGVEEAKAGRSNIVGVKEHLDDAKLHQFVNSKTQAAVEFSYRIVQVENVEVGVIEIPLQQRPIYLKKQYDRLRENDVYIRDGSSTRVSTPDEIAKMGAQHVVEEAPQFLLEWVDLKSGKPIPPPITLQTLALYPWLPDDTFSLPRPRSRLGYIDIPPNPNYSKEVMNYAFNRAFFAGLGVQVYNNSRVAGRRIRFEGSMSKVEGLLVRDYLEAQPKKYLDGIVDPSLTTNPYNHVPSSELQEYTDRWEITIDFGDIRPHQRVVTTSPIWFGSASSLMTSLDGLLLGDNLPDPLQHSLEIQFEVEVRPMKREDVELYLDQG